jgi:hypothetical protein
MYMFNKYGEKYCTRDELDKYLDKYDHDLGWKLIAWKFRFVKTRGYILL